MLNQLFKIRNILMWIAVTIITQNSVALAGDDILRAAVPPQAIEYILVINMENEDYGTTFGPTSPATYLNTTLLKEGQLIPNYFATSHVSLGNYISQISGQAPTVSINNDCLNLASLTHPPLVGGFNDIMPGTDADPKLFPGQIIGDGCVFPAPSKIGHGAITIGDQLDLKPFYERWAVHELKWRAYAEDMGIDTARDYGDYDAMGGNDCAHPAVGGTDNTNSASPTDQYATRHNPFMYFHSIIDDQNRCDKHVVPLGKVLVGSNGSADSFSGHLYEDLRDLKTTPKFMFVIPNLCNNGHDATCAGSNTEGTRDANGKNIGGLAAADLWLKHWMPMIFSSHAYRTGKLLVVLTFDESGLKDARACPNQDQTTCNSPTGPNVSNPGFSAILGMYGLQTKPTTTFVYPGGGQVGAVLFNSRFIAPGSVNTTGYYNHYSALRSYEDILGITTGGDDGLGHIGFAAAPNLKPFGKDVFNLR